MARPRTPLKLKIAKGTFDSTRDKDRLAEPSVHPPRVPDAPEHLEDDEQKTWEEFARVLDPNKVTTDEDLAALEDLVCTTSELRRARAVIRKLGGEMTYETFNEKTGARMLRVRPEMQVISDSSRRMLNLLGRFGLTPADRSRVKVLRDEANRGKSPEDEF